MSKLIFKTIIFFLLNILFISEFNLSGFAEENIADSPKMRIGVFGDFAYYNVNNTYGYYPKWEGDIGYGGGFVFESMFNDVFGIYSALSYGRSKLKITAPFGDDESEEENILELEITSDFITIPLYLITSLNSRYITVNLLTGFNFSYILESHMSSESESEDIKKYLNYGQMGVGGGVEFLFRITRFTKIFIAGISEYYLTDLISDSHSHDNLYNFKIRSGFMLCTF